MSEYDAKYKGVVIKGSVFPDKKIKTNLNIWLSKEIKTEYFPALNKVMEGQPRGLKLLCTAMALKEGFRKGSRSHRTNNPGNIGNIDSGGNINSLNLETGILLQKNYILKIATGKHRSYRMNKIKFIRPYFSKEIARNSKTYGMSPWLPGYEFIFTGQLDQFVKIYSTGARAGNGYLSMILSYFRQNGIYLQPDCKIQDIIKIT